MFSPSSLSAEPVRPLIWGELQSPDSSGLGLPKGRTAVGAVFEVGEYSASSLCRLILCYSRVPCDATRN